jgi:thiol-disulfide isomerase/thioredoxin
MKLQDLALPARCLAQMGLCIVALGSMSQSAMAAEAQPADSLVMAAREGALGTPAPALKLTTIDGDTIDLAALYGRKAVYLKFWATWCVPCRAQMPHFESVYQNAGDELAVIALNAGFNDERLDILDYREDLGIHMPIVVDDGTLASLLHLRITPQHVVIGKDGRIKHIGHLADAELDAVLERERRAPDVPANVVQATVAAAPHLGVGAALPAATVVIGDDRIALSDKAAKGTVLVFMIPWCESYLASSRPEQAKTCRQVREQLEALKQQHPDMRWLGVSSGLWTVGGDLKTYAQASQVTLPLALDADGQLFRTFGVMTVPTVIVADAEGRIVSRMKGHDDSLAQTIGDIASE